MRELEGKTKERASSKKMNEKRWDGLSGSCYLNVSWCVCRMIFVKEHFSL